MSISEIIQLGLFFIAFLGIIIEIIKLTIKK